MCRRIELAIGDDWPATCNSDAISCRYTVDVHLPVSAPSNCVCCSETLSEVRRASSSS